MLNKKPGKPKPKSKPKPSGKMAVYALALLSIFMALPASAGVYPYVGITGDRLSDVERWSTGATIGADVTKNWVCLNVHADVHDILAKEEDNVYPFDLTVGGGAGVFKTLDLAGVAVTASGLLTLDRPSDVDRFSVGSLVAGEAAFDQFYGEVSLQWFDIWTADGFQVYEWNQRVRLAVGYYLGDPPSADPPSAESGD